MLHNKKVYSIQAMKIISMYPPQLVFTWAEYKTLRLVNDFDVYKDDLTPRYPPDRL